jgi:hypothetical protein
MSLCSVFGDYKQMKHSHYFKEIIGLVGEKTQIFIMQWVECDMIQDHILQVLWICIPDIYKRFKGYYICI